MTRLTLQCILVFWMPYERLSWHCGLENDVGGPLLWGLLSRNLTQPYFGVGARRKHIFSGLSTSTTTTTSDTFVYESRRFPLVILENKFSRNNIVCNWFLTWCIPLRLFPLFKSWFGRRQRSHAHSYLEYREFPDFRPCFMYWNFILRMVCVHCRNTTRKLSKMLGLCRWLKSFDRWNTLKTFDDILKHLEADVLCFQGKSFTFFKELTLIALV